MLISIFVALLVIIYLLYRIVANQKQGAINDYNFASELLKAIEEVTV